MRYIIDPEFREARPRPARPSKHYAADLRRELSVRNLQWALRHPGSHEVSLGNPPAILYREDDAGNHGNFLADSYRRIRETPAWARRLTKVHTSAKRALLSRDPDRRELDSSNSSDALLMNIFCHPEVLTSQGTRLLLGIDTEAEPQFGYKPGVPLQSGRRDCTEVDLKLADLLIEAKLTEYDFQTASRKLIDRYRDLEEVFNLDDLEILGTIVVSYQLIRGVLAAHATDQRFCVLCDARRPDLIAAWHRILRAVRIYDLRCRLLLLTWQELAATLPGDLQIFLEAKYGIVP
ncbi:PGN_0703 family putative restriction endonuclease [Granulicella arctica]|uniref:PGN_0703 family putative restriction endonuclease n=1 Tax=Granulicella arctica TaxID=940613 RepID=UPI0021E031CB|nr:hypothetical protein [Granulicella arctica]